MTFPTLFSQNRILDTYRQRLQWHVAYAGTANLTPHPMDVFLMRQLAAMYPVPPTLIDLACVSTLGESSVIWAGENSPIAGVIAGGVSWQTAPNRDWSPICAEMLAELPHDLSWVTANVDDATVWQTLRQSSLFRSPHVMVIAHPDDDQADHDLLLKSLTLWDADAVFILPLGAVGTSRNLEALLKLASTNDEYAVSLMREISPFMADSQMALVYKSSSVYIPSILERCRQLFAGNFDFLTLLKSHADSQFNRIVPAQASSPVAADISAAVATPQVNSPDSNHTALPSSHRWYARLRPLLKQYGISRAARTILPDAARAKIAMRLGLAGFNQHGTPITIPTPTPIPETLPPRSQRITQPKATLGINYVADLRADVGLSQSARLLFEAMQHARIPATYTETGLTFASRAHDIELSLPTGHPHPFTIAHVNPSEFVHMRQQTPSGLFDPAKYAIAVWYWELPDFPRKWHWLFNQLDEIWVTSAYVQGIIARAAPVPVVQIPLPVVAPHNPQITRQHFNLPEKRFIFLFTFDPASSMGRKNPFGVIEAFRRAFGAPKSDGPLLVLKTMEWKYAHTSTGQQAVLDALQSVNGIILDERLSREDTNNLINVCDCFVSLHRAEGFGLGMAEAMYLRKPVIATAYSGNMAFMSDQNAYPVRYKLRQISLDDHTHQPIYVQVYEPGQWWAEPDLDHAAEFMQQVYVNPHAARERGQHAYDYMKQWHSYDISGQAIRQRLDTIMYHQQAAKETLP